MATTYLTNTARFSVHSPSQVLVIHHQAASSAMSDHGVWYHNNVPMTSEQEVGGYIIWKGPITQSMYAVPIQGSQEQHSQFKQQIKLYTVITMILGPGVMRSTLSLGIFIKRFRNISSMRIKFNIQVKNKMEFNCV
jgi:hypothetical protein